MNTCSIHFRCPWCCARIKAPRQLIGQSRDCPGCKHSFVVPRFVTEDAGPMFVQMEDEERGSFAVAGRTR